MRNSLTSSRSIATLCLLPTLLAAHALAQGFRVEMPVNSSTTGDATISNPCTTQQTYDVTSTSAINWIGLTRGHEYTVAAKSSGSVPIEISPRGVPPGKYEATFRVMRISPSTDAAPCNQATTNFMIDVELVAAPATPKPEPYSTPVTPTSTVTTPEKKITTPTPSKKTTAPVRPLQKIPLKPSTAPSSTTPSSTSSTTPATTTPPH